MNASHTYSHSCLEPLHLQWSFPCEVLTILSEILQIWINSDPLTDFYQEAELFLVIIDIIFSLNSFMDHISILSAN